MKYVDVLEDLLMFGDLTGPLVEYAIADALSVPLGTAV